MADVGRRFRVTHPFLPQYGQEYESIGTFESPQGLTLVIHGPHHRKRFILARWTDWSPEEPAKVIARGHCPLLLPQLLQLADLMARLKGVPIPSRNGRKALIPWCIGDYATDVKENTQQHGPVGSRHAPSKSTRRQRMWRLAKEKWYSGKAQSDAKSILLNSTSPSPVRPWGIPISSKERSSDKQATRILAPNESRTRSSSPTPSSIPETSSRSATKWSAASMWNARASLRRRVTLGSLVPPSTKLNSDSGRMGSPVFSGGVLVPRALERFEERSSRSWTNFEPGKADSPTGNSRIVSKPGTARASIPPPFSERSATGEKNSAPLDRGKRREGKRDTLRGAEGHHSRAGTSARRSRPPRVAKRGYARMAPGRPEQSHRFQGDISGGAAPFHSSSVGVHPGARQLRHQHRKRRKT